MSVKKILAACVLGVAVLCTGIYAEAYAKYPTSTIKIIVQSNPGSGTDIFARQLAALLSEELDQTVIVANQPGGGGNLAANTLAKSKPDGYTLGVLTEDVVGMNFANLNVAYKVDDLIPISHLIGTSFGFYANGTSEWNNFADVVKTAKEENRPIKVAVYDSMSRYVLASLSESTGVEFTMVPSQSAATALTAVLGGHVELSTIGGAQSDSIIAGKAKLLGSLTHNRFIKVPDVPTLFEQGFEFKPHSASSFLFVPSGTPDEIVEILEATIIKLGNTEKYKSILSNQAANLPDAFGREEADKLVKRAYDFAMEIKANK